MLTAVNVAVADGLGDADGDAEPDGRAGPLGAAVRDAEADAEAAAEALGLPLPVSGSPVPADTTVPASDVTPTSLTGACSWLLTMFTDSGAVPPAGYPFGWYATSTSRSDTLRSAASAYAPGTAATVLSVWVV